MKEGTQNIGSGICENFASALAVQPDEILTNSATRTRSARCRLLEILASTGKKVSELLADVPKTFSTPEIRVDCPDDKKFKVVKKVTEHFRKDYDIVDIDGVRVLFDDGWGLVRASNTQPALVLRFEAMTGKRLEEIRELVEGALDQVKKDA